MAILDNIYQDIPKTLTEELTENLLANDLIRIERIISKGHSTAENKWYNQTEDEWILLIQGEAQLLFKEPDKKIHLKTGDFFHIPSGWKHQVTWTPSQQETIWLAIFFA